MRYAHTGYTLLTQGSASTLTWGYLNLPALLLAVSIFVFVKYLCNLSFFRREDVQKKLRFLASASFGVFLIHIFIMNLLTSKLGIDLYGTTRQFVLPFVVYGVSLVIVKFVQMNRFGKYIFP